MNFSSESQKKFRLYKPAVDREVRRAAFILISVSRSFSDSLPGGVGLCVNCKFMRTIQSDRGSVFYQCQLSATNPGFPKYPRLPVLRCAGYEPVRTTP